MPRIILVTLALSLFGCDLAHSDRPATDTEYSDEPDTTCHQLTDGRRYRVRLALVRGTQRAGWRCDGSTCHAETSLDPDQRLGVPQPCEADAWITSAPTVYETGHALSFSAEL